MNTLDPTFLRTLTAPVSYMGVGPFAAVRVEILSGVANCADGYRFRPLVDRRPEDAPDPVWHELPGEWFAGDAFSAADIQMSFPLEAAASRGGLDASRPRLKAFLERIHARPAYRRALERGGEYAYAE